MRTWRQHFKIPEPQSNASTPAEPQAPEEQPPEPSIERPARKARLDKVVAWEPKRSKGGRVLRGLGIGVVVTFGALAWLVVIAQVCAPDDDTETSARHASALCDRPAEARYLAGIDRAMVSAEAGGDDLSRLMDELARNPALVLHPDFVRDLKAGIALMRSGVDELIDLQAPDSLSEIDREAKNMARELHASLNLYSVAIDDIDGSKLNQGTERILNAADYMESMMETWARVCGL